MHLVRQPLKHDGRQDIFVNVPVHGHEEGQPQGPLFVIHPGGFGHGGVNRPRFGAMQFSALGHDFQKELRVDGTENLNDLILGGLKNVLGTKFLHKGRNLFVSKNAAVNIVDGKRLHGEILIPKLLCLFPQQFHFQPSRQSVQGRGILGRNIQLVVGAVQKVQQRWKGIGRQLFHFEFGRILGILGGFNELTLGHGHGFLKEIARVDSSSFQFGFHFGVGWLTYLLLEKSCGKVVGSLGTHRQDGLVHIVRLGGIRSLDRHLHGPIRQGECGITSPGQLIFVNHRVAIAIVILINIAHLPFLLHLFQA
mmetsp:Transcript_8554/g.23687  ORF Transcript_8554/g.23687 Transcript_8554/m.23687 type:complete len:308 (-) Transcript_8554:62-985(-)